MNPIPSIPDFHCETVLRRFADRRATLGGKRLGQACIAKCFFLPAGQKDLNRELAGYQTLSHLKLPIARCLAQDHSAASHTHIIYYEHLTHQTLKRLWGSLTSSAQRDWLFELANWFAALHAHGFLHRDPHLDNFIQSDGNKFLLDYAAIQTPSWRHKKSNSALNIFSSLDNLALLAAQFEPDRQLRRCLLMFYAQASHWSWLNKLEPIFWYWTQKRYHLREKRYLHKIFRNCTQSQIIDTANGQGHCRRAVFDQLNPWLENLDALLQHPSVHLLKKGNTATVWSVKIHDLSVVIKRYNIKSFGHFLQRAFRASRAKHSWWASHLLEFYDLPTPQPLAWLQCKKWGLNHRSYFICQELQGQPIIKTDKQQCEDLIVQLHQHHISHGDLKATNFINERDKIYLIDLDAVCNQHWKNKLTNAYKKDWVRWKKNWDSVQDGSNSITMASMQALENYDRDIL